MTANVARTFDRYFETAVYANRLAQERTPDDPMKLVQLRRTVSEVTSEMQRIVDAIVQENGLTDTQLPILAEHRARFAAERSAVANHQANWAAPAMAKDRDRYQADVNALFKMHENNHRWRKQVFIPALETAIRNRRRN